MKSTCAVLNGATLTAVGLALLAAPAEAQSTEERMVQRIEALERELATLKGQLKAQAAAQAKAQQDAQAQAKALADAQAKAVAAADAQTKALADAQAKALADAQAKAQADAQNQKPEEPLIKMRGGRPVLTTPDGNFSIGLTGKVNFDVAQYFQQPSSIQPDPRTVPDLNSGENFRRAQIGVVGDIFKDFEYTLIFDMGGSPDGTSSLEEASLAYKGLKPFTFQIGAFNVPLTLEDSTSSNEITFLERASAVNIATSQTAGTARNAVGVKANGEQWFAATFLTGSTPGNEDDDEPVGAAVRVAGRPLMDKDYNLHLGAWGTELFHPAQNQGSVTGVQLRDRPELRVDSNRLIDTGLVPADRFSAWGLEAAGNYRNFSLQGEYMKYYIHQNHGPNPTVPRPNLDFDGYYIFGSWVITGESRIYSASRASLGAPRPAHPFSLTEGTWGAFELAYRYSVANLNDQDPPFGVALSTTGGIRGGEQTIHTVGLNWYLNPYIRFMFNYLHVDVDRLNSAGTVQVGQTYDAIALRTQVNW